MSSRCEGGYDPGYIYDPYVINWESNQQYREERQRYLSRHPERLQQQDEAEPLTTHEAREQQRSLSRQWEASLQPANLLQQDQGSEVRRRTQTPQIPLPAQRGLEQQGASPLKLVGGITRDFLITCKVVVPTNAIL
jgi:hypothetical protein